MKGSSYLEKKSNSRDLLLNFKNMLVNQDLNTEHEKRIALKLNMFLGSVYEVLYENKLLKKINTVTAIFQIVVDGLRFFAYKACGDYNLQSPFRSVFC